MPTKPRSSLTAVPSRDSHQKFFASFFQKRSACFLLICLLCSPAVAQPEGLAEAASRRFPQPVRVGDLLKRKVLAPQESQPVLGRVRDIVKRPDSTLDVVVDYGGIFGFFARPIAVPVDGMVLLGQYMEILGFTPAQLGNFKTFSASSATSLPPDSIIRVGISGPSH